MPLGGGGGVSNFVELLDTPPSLAGQATKFPKVNAGETALEFAGGAHLIALLEALSAQAWAQQFNNLLRNVSFESWSLGAAAAPDGWAVAGAAATIAREATIIRFGEYSAKLTRVGNDCYLYSDGIATIDADTNTYWRGREVTLGCWVYATVANRAQIKIDDMVGETLSSFHSGVAGWEFLTVTRTLDAAAQRIRAVGQIMTGNTSAYFDGAILVEGPICPAFAPAAVEQVVGPTWQAWVPILTGGADLSGYNVARFCLHGKTCFFVFNAVAKNVTTGGIIQITLPYTVPNGWSFTVSGQVYDGAAWIGQPFILVNSNTNYMTVAKTAAQTAWAGTEVGVWIILTGFYEIA